MKGIITIEECVETTTVEDGDVVDTLVRHSEFKHYEKQNGKEINPLLLKEETYATDVALGMHMASR